MTTFENAKVGDRVWCMFYAEWATITNIVKEDVFPIKTNINSYTMDGKLSKGYARTLFWDEVVITPPPKPLPRLEVDTKVLVWDSYQLKQKAYFSHFDSKTNKICVFPFGKTSWSNDSNTQIWQHWELAKD